MVWGAICKYGKSPIHVFETNERENQQKYQEILEKRLLPWAKDVYHEGFYVLYQDNAGPHKGHKVMSWMENNIPYAPEIPALSPDLNPIEFIWAMLKKKVEKTQPQNIEDLKKSIITCWEEIDQAAIIKCIRRKKEVYEIKGEFHT